MKRLLFLLLSALIGFHPWLKIQAADVRFDLGDFLDSQLTNRLLTVTITDAPRVSEGSGRIIIGSSITRTSDYAGLVIISNMVEATYRCTVAGTLGNAFQISVPYTNVLLNAKYLLTTTPSSPSATTAYSQAAANARFLLRDGGYGTNTTLSNVVLLGTITGVVTGSGSTRLILYTNGVEVGTINGLSFYTNGVLVGTL